MAEMLPHQFGAQPIAAERHGCAVASVARGERRLRVATGSPEKQLRRMVAPGHYFANTVAVAVGTRRTEHDLALKEHGFDAGVFLTDRKLHRVPLSCSGYFCIRKSCLHDWDG